MRTIIMTGGTSGFGRLALSQLQGPDRQVEIGARGAGPDGVTTLPLNLSSLARVRQFAVRVVEETAKIDALILNAGLHSTDPTARSAEDYELTFATNHLGHYLLLRLLMPRLADDATVIITTSGTHDPAERSGFPPPPRRCFPPRPPSGIPASTAYRGWPPAAPSMRHRSWRTCLPCAGWHGWPRRRDADGPSWPSAPGQVPGTGLVRKYPLPMRLGWRLAGTLAAAPFAARLMGVNTAPAAAAALTGVVEGGIRPPPGRLYAALRRGEITWPDPSDLARRDDVADALWRDSEVLAGLSDPPVPG